MKLLQKALTDGSLVLNLKAADVASIFHQAMNLAVAKGALSTEFREVVERELLAREKEFPSALGNSVAVPHVYMDAISKPTIVFVRLDHPINLGAPDGVPTRFMFFLLGPERSASEHLETLASIARLMSDEAFRYEALVARSADELLAAMRHFRERTEEPPEPAKREIPESLHYTGRLFGGMMLDLKRRLPQYWSDFRDGLHPKTLSSTLFLFFACLAPAVTFGGVMAEQTGNHIGVVEMIVGTAVCGVIYALIAGQPLIILGGTGPLLIFTVLLYDVCGEIGLGDYFLETRAWVGLWTAALLLLLAATDSSCLMRFFTRFTDEIFAALISIIFIVLAIGSLGNIVTKVYGEETSTHDPALVPLLLAAGTFGVALALSRFRRSRYLLPQMRMFLTDFGPTIALGAMTAVAVIWFWNVDLNTLNAPDQLTPSIERAWFLDLFKQGMPSWVWIAALGPAVLVAMLVFMDQNITARLVNSPDHRLEKGEAYHHDLAVMGVLIGACSLFGLPWLVAATVRSLNHVHSLATMEEVVQPGGETRERVLHVRETRLTGLAIHLLVAVSLLMLPVLKLIPMAVLYGLFLFMGVVSLGGNQFFERMKLWLMDRNLYPSTHYIRKVPVSTIHKFTLLQLVCLTALGLVELTVLGILFPLFIVLLVPVRLLAGRFFAPQHLAILDAEQEPEEEEEEWV